ncbi:MAG: CocE/NonD family hydrolase, partial [Actinomycetota bacterium]
MARSRASLGLVALALVVGATTALGPGGDRALAQQVLPCDFGSNGDYSGSYAKVSKPGPHEIGEQQIVELESKRDGVTIQMGLIRPEVPVGTKMPVIVGASPYYHPLQNMDLRACRPFLTENYVAHGYAVALLAIRGTADSGGCMNLMGPDERADLDQAVTWLGRQPWSNGSVGMVGLSYDGATQWEVASFGNRYLKTIVPVSGVPDVFELMYGGGRVDWRGPGALNGIYYLESAGFYAPGRSPEHTAEVTACPEYATGMAASMHSGATGEPDPFGYWAGRRYRDEIVKRYRGSIYLVQGLQDWNVNPGQQFPWIWEFERRGVYVKYLLGQWGHAWPYSNGNRMDWADILLRWLDRWLKDDEGAALGPRVQVQDAAGRWRNASRWPAGDEVTFHLNPDGDLSRQPARATATELVATDPFHTQGGCENNMPTENLACAPGT